MTLPVVTVATVVYNGAQEIARTIDSVLVQDYPNVEYVVVDGNSTDGTGDIVRRYGSRIGKFVCEPDRGIYDGMNKAVAHATGEFILFMNCGDVFEGPDALINLVQAAHLSASQVVFGGWSRQDKNGRQTQLRPNLIAGLFNHQAILYSRGLHAKFGAYAVVPGLTTADYLFFTALAVGGNVRYTVLDKTVAQIDTGGISSGLQTLSQKYAIDYLCGRVNRYKLAAVLLLHPLYTRIKSALKALR
jgi:glycosyltransferase involved in cell wall biosynthesis